MEVSEDSVNCRNNIDEFYNLISDKTKTFFAKLFVSDGRIQFIRGRQLALLLRIAQMQRTP